MGSCPIQERKDPKVRLSQLGTPGILFTVTGDLGFLGDLNSGCLLLGQSQVGLPGTDRPDPAALRGDATGSVEEG